MKGVYNGKQYVGTGELIKYKRDNSRVWEKNICWDQKVKGDSKEESKKAIESKVESECWRV